MAVAVDHDAALPVGRALRIRGIPGLPEGVRAGLHHAAPVVPHVEKRLLAETRAKQSRDVVVVHVGSLHREAVHELLRPLHEVFRLLRVEDIREHVPDLGDEGSLAARDEALPLLVVVVLPRAGLEPVQLLHEPLGLGPVIFPAGQTPRVAHRVNENRNAARALVHPLAPVKEDVRRILLRHPAFPVDEPEAHLDLLHRDIVEVV